MRSVSYVVQMLDLIGNINYIFTSAFNLLCYVMVEHHTDRLTGIERVFLWILACDAAS